MIPTFIPFVISRRCGWWAALFLPSSILVVLVEGWSGHKIIMIYKYSVLLSHYWKQSSSITLDLECIHLHPILHKKNRTAIQVTVSETW
ncbi:hypothetical protein VTO42DRAFT_4516 [Malbranchea cinnamomea]